MLDVVTRADSMEVDHAAAATAIVLHRHLAALGQGVEAVLANYSDDALLITERAMCRGRAEIRVFFEGFSNNASGHFRETFDVHSRTVVGEVAFITWSAKPQVMFGTDTLIVRANRIVLQTFAAYSGCPTLRDFAGRRRT